MLDTSVRLLRLLTILQTRPEWTGAELAQRLEVTPRTLRRDVARLRELDYPVHATPGVAGGYRLAAGTTLPPLLLDDDEAVAVVLGLSTATSHTVTGIAETSLRALTKLDRVLPARLRQRTAALRLATVPMSNQSATVDPDLLTAIAEACHSLQRIGFDYSDHSGRPTSRTVEPHRLVHTGRRWYLVARDTDRDDWRTFRVDRIGNPRPSTTRFVPRDPPDAAAFVANAVAAAPYRYLARVIVQGPADDVANRIPPTAAVVEAIDQDTCLLTTGADSVGFIAMHLALLGNEFTVLEPPELIAELAVLAARLTRAHDNLGCLPRAGKG